jgi:PAS domain S-box-containing protein
VAVLGYLAGIRQTNGSTGTPPRTYALNFNGVHLRLTAGLLGLSVIFMLTVLFVAALLLAIVARRRHRRAVAANLEMEKEIIERQHVQQELQEQKTLLQTTFDSMGEAIVVSDENGRLLLSNPAAERILGKVLLESIPDKLSGAHGAFLTAAEAEMPLVKATRGEATDDVPLLIQCGHPAQEKWLSVSGRPLRRPDGSLRGGLAVFGDITERKRALEALEESQERYRTLAETLPHLVWTCKPDGWCDYLSGQWVEYTGRPAEEQLGYAWTEHLHDEDRVAIQAAWAQAAARGRPFDLEFRLRRADGVYRWFKTRAVPLRDAAGGIVKWFGSNTDFDDFKKAEQRLQAQLQRLNLLDQITQAIAERQDMHSVFQVVVRSLEDNLPIDFGCVCLYDPALDALTVTCVGVRNERLARELTMTEQAHIGVDQNGLARCLRGELVYEPDTSQLDFPFPRRLSNSGLRAVVVTPLSSESGTFAILVAARRQPNSFTSGDCEFLRQLSQHVALAARQTEIYAALQKAYDDLRQTQQAVLHQERLRVLGQMASGIAHDINNALSPVALYTESLLEREPNLSARTREYLETTQRAIDDVAHTVGRMREFYRQREPQLMLLPADLNRLVQEVLDLSRARWSDIPQQQGIVIQVRTELAPDLPAMAGIESEVREALINLVFNAVDAMPEGGTLTMRTKATRIVSEANASQSILVEVEDTGIGMDEETRRRCLEPFFTTKGERGTGLGLAMVYGVAQRLNAEIDIESAVGRGTMVA